MPLELCRALQWRRSVLRRWGQCPAGGVCRLLRDVVCAGHFLGPKTKVKSDALQGAFAVLVSQESPKCFHLGNLACCLSDTTTRCSGGGEDSSMNIKAVAMPGRQANAGFGYWNSIWVFKVSATSSFEAAAQRIAMEICVVISMNIYKEDIVCLSRSTQKFYFW